MSRRRWWADARAIGVLVLAAVTFGFSGWVLVRDPPPVQAVPGYAAPQPTRGPVVSLWIGDSYTAGTGAASAKSGEACLTAAKLHWVCKLDAQGGTGFVADGHVNSSTYSPMGGRIDGTAAKNAPDVVVIDAGRNDSFFPRDKVKAAMRSYFERVHQAWPDTATVVIAPYILGPGDGTPHDAAWIGGYEKTLAGKYGWWFVDPVAEGWPADTARLTIKDGVHPSPEGHKWIAGHLAKDLAGVKPQAR